MTRLNREAKLKMERPLVVSQPRSGLTGHRGHTALPQIKQVVNSPAVIGLQPGTQHFKMGKCKILVSPPTGDQGWHMSISCRDRYPSWDEIAKARYTLLPQQLPFMMILPPPEEYVNVHEYCFHLHENIELHLLAWIRDAQAMLMRLGINPETMKPYNTKASLPNPSPDADQIATEPEAAGDA